MKPSDDGFYHPTTEDQLIALVQLARLERRQLRVCGSGRSVETAIYTDGRLSGEGTLSIDVSLDCYTEVRFGDAGRVTVQAGCRMGASPGDPGALWDASLFVQLEARGWALPDVGGIAAQTISGFLLTGLGGGTVRHAFTDSIVALRFIDGTGCLHEVIRDRDPLFDAFGCSMGLLGVLSSVTLQCVPRFDIIGREDITTVGEFPLFEDGLVRFFRATEYARLMWWPQRGLERVVAWQAHTMSPADYTSATGPSGALRPKPYCELGNHPPWPGATSAAVQRLAGAFYDSIALGRSAMQRLDSVAPRTASTLRLVGSPLFERLVLSGGLRQFVPLDHGHPQHFWDVWHHGLPMDSDISEAALPTAFAELFVPLDDAVAVMGALRAHFQAGGVAATGTFVFEAYASRASRFWLHPSAGCDSLRIDVFWFKRNRELPDAFFAQFFELLAPFGYRAHWGKHLPREGADYLHRQFPRWNEFLATRRELDPDGLFLTNHWRNAFGLE